MQALIVVDVQKRVFCERSKTCSKSRESTGTHSFSSGGRSAKTTTDRPGYSLQQTA